MEWNRKYSKEKIQIGNKYIFLKKCSVSLAVIGMQNKTTLRFHLIPIRMGNKKTNDNKCSQGCGCESVDRYISHEMSMQVS